MNKADLKAYLSKIGRRGGKTNTDAQNAARRENGKKGGRPLGSKNKSSK